MAVKIVVIVPTLHATKILKKQLNLFKNQTISSEILIIDSSSSDNTVQIAKTKGAEVYEIFRSDFNHATTRNLVLQKEADFYLFMTQDALPYDDKLVENLLKPFEDEDVVVGYARQIPHEDADLIEKFARETNYPPVPVVKSKESLKEMGIKTFFCSNSCAIYRVSYFKEAGGFTEGLIMNEDMEFAARAVLDGKKVAYAAEAKVWHSHRYTAKDIFKRYFDIGIFFKTNGWIREEINKYSSTESTGVKQAKKELAYLFKNAPLSIPKSILFSLTKFVAYKLGYHYERLPLRLVKKFSLHQNFHKTRLILKSSLSKR